MIFPGGHRAHISVDVFAVEQQLRCSRRRSGINLLLAPILGWGFGWLGTRPRTSSGTIASSWPRFRAQ